MRRIFIAMAGVCVAMGLALQEAQAGERKHVANLVVQAHASHAVVLAAPARSAGKAQLESGKAKGESLRTEGPATAGKLRTEVGAGNSGHGEFYFVPVSPLSPAVRGPATAGKLQSEAGRANGPSTSPRERKSLTFFRLDPKFGDVSVQPVVGGVNGAQVSLGF